MSVSLSDYFLFLSLLTSSSLMLSLIFDISICGTQNLFVPKKVLLTHSFPDPDRDPSSLLGTEEGVRDSVYPIIFTMENELYRGLVLYKRLKLNCIVSLHLEKLCTSNSYIFSNHYCVFYDLRFIILRNVPFVPSNSIPLGVT